MGGTGWVEGWTDQWMDGWDEWMDMSQRLTVVLRPADHPKCNIHPTALRTRLPVVHGHAGRDGRLLQLVHRGHEGAAVGALRGHRPQEPV